MFIDLSIFLTIQATKKQFPNNLNIKDPFIIIGVPGSLCLVHFCLKFLPQSEKIIFVSNGLDEFERKWVSENLNVDKIIYINKLIPHGVVIDIFLEKFRKPFGILDFDCFVFSPSILSELKILDKNSMMNSIFSFENKKLSLEIPETYLLFFNTPLINEIKKRYRVNSEVTTIEKLNNKLKMKLKTIGIDKNNYPDTHRGNFLDTLRLWYLLGLTDGYRCNFVRKYPFYPLINKEIFHVGGGHKTGKLNTVWNTRGTYLWRRALETCCHQELQKYYRLRYGSMTSHQIFDLAPELCDQAGQEFFTFINDLFDNYCLETHSQIPI